MSHNHSSHSSESNIKIAFFLNVGFTIAEFLGGLWTNSLAITADAVHDLGDSFSLGLSWVLERISHGKPTSTFSYGLRRVSLVGALINALVLFVGILIVLAKALPRLIDPQHSNAHGMLVFALVGVAVNGLAAYKVARGKTLNEQIVSWHLWEDVLGWAAVLVVSIVLLFWDIHILDPILSILISLYVLWNVVKNLKRTILIFLQAVPDVLDIHAIERAILGQSEVKAVHDTHLWSLDGERHIFSAHIVYCHTLTAEQSHTLKKTVKYRLMELGIHHATLEMESETEACQSACDLVIDKRKIQE